MTGVKVLRLLRWWKIPPRGWIIILGELAVIITLASWVYSEYVNNLYFQSYVNGLSPILLPIVSVGFGITSAIVATLLYFTMKNMRQRDEPMEGGMPKRRGLAKKTSKKPQVSPSSSGRPSTGGLALVPRSKGLIAGASGSKRGGVPDAREKEDE
jgi:hypothetical protein